MNTTVRGTWSPEDQAVSRYQYLSFDVPVGCAGVTIRLKYDPRVAVLDLGLIDAVGWCGWSGGARDEVQIGPAEATPGYIPRGVLAGQWQVVIGLHHIPAGGVNYTIEIEFGHPQFPADPGPPPVLQRPPRRELPAESGSVWLAGDLHAHTVHSDGGLTIEQLAALACRQGLDFLAITDHNTISHHRCLPDVSERFGIDLLAGQELTTSDGHANAFGDIGWIDFREPAARWFDEVAERGGLCSVNHPVSGDCSWRHSLIRSPNVAEVWHSSWQDRRDGGALAWWRAHGLQPVPIGGSDWHHSGALPGSPTTWVACQNSSVLGGIATGRTAISMSRDGPVLLPVGDELVAVGADGARLVCPDGRRIQIHGSQVRFRGHQEPHLLEANDGTVLGIAA